MFKTQHLIFSFPNDLTLRKIWLEGCGYAHEKFFPHSKLCSLHFDESSYKITKSRRLLKDNAIPTKFEKNSNFDFGVKPNKYEFTDICIVFISTITIFLVTDY